MLQNTAAQLNNEDWSVRLGVIKALQGRADLTEEMLQGIIAQLDDGFIHRAAAKALRSWAHFSEEMLQNIAARLENKDWSVRRAAIEALQGHVDLPEELQQRIAARLEDKVVYVRMAAMEGLMNRARLPLDALSPYIKPFYEALRRKSFTEHLFWHPSDSGFIRAGLRHISLSSRQ